MAEEISKGYQPGDVETQWYSRWLEAGCFRGDEKGTKPSYSIVIPPPNVTGILHLGHVLNNTIQDILARRARMEGKDVLWLPGTDHAGIATQSKVEQKLRKEEGKTRRDLGRDAFLEKVWEWKESTAASLFPTEATRLLLRLGARAFHDGRGLQPLGLEGLRRPFPRGPHLPRQTHGELVPQIAHRPERRGGHHEGPEVEALHDALPRRGASDRWVEIATTRPETLMGDTAVAVHPKDPRYLDLIGKTVIRPSPRRRSPWSPRSTSTPSSGPACSR